MTVSVKRIHTTNLRHCPSRCFFPANMFLARIGHPRLAPPRGMNLIVRPRCLTCSRDSCEFAHLSERGCLATIEAKMKHFMRRIWRKVNGFTFRKRKKAFKHVVFDEAVEIHRLYARGHSMVDIARLLDRSPCTVWRVLHRDGPKLKRFVQEMRSKAKANGLNISHDVGHYRAGHRIDVDEDAQR